MPTPEGYCAVRTLTEELAAPLSAEDQTVQSMPDVSPTKWHRAHTSWFFETFVLGPHAADYAPFNADYCHLFNSYYEAVGARHPRPERGLLSRPGIDDIAAYRAHVDGAVVDLLTSSPDQAVLDLIELGLHHEQQHQELLLMDIKHVLSVNPLAPVYREARLGERGSFAATEWISFPGGLVEIGHDGDGFAFDNEGPRHPVHLQPFALAACTVTNGEWLEFIADSCYQRPELWLSDGWATVQEQLWDAPLYWRREGDSWDVFTLAGRKQLNLAAPVCHVSYYEADAFARWAGARLPTEAEWETAVAGSPVTGRFLDLDVLQPRPPAGGSDLRHAFGDVWEWTASPYTPYRGFRPAAGAVGEYNGKFMVNQHVLRGGGCVTPPGHVRATYRNFFPPASRWAFSGVRLARDV
jgi:ergothioneine biosynthesis protein EgtB